MVHAYSEISEAALHVSPDTMYNADPLIVRQNTDGSGKSQPCPA